MHGMHRGLHGLNSGQWSHGQENWLQKASIVESAPCSLPTMNQSYRKRRSECSQHATTKHCARDAFSHFNVASTETSSYRRLAKPQAQAGAWDPAAKLPVPELEKVADEGQSTGPQFGQCMLHTCRCDRCAKKNFLTCDFLIFAIVCARKRYETTRMSALTCGFVLVGQRKRRDLWISVQLHLQTHLQPAWMWNNGIFQHWHVKLKSCDADVDFMGQWHQKVRVCKFGMYICMYSSIIYSAAHINSVRANVPKCV